MESISNPQKIFDYKRSLNSLRENINHVINKFPKEYRLLDDKNGLIKILILARYPNYLNVTGDMILTISEQDNNILYQITNERGIISSYTEQERDKYAMEIFIKLLDLSIAGQLDKNVQKVQAKNQPSSLQGIVGIITLLVALYAIFQGMKGCSM